MSERATSETSVLIASLLLLSPPPQSPLHSPSPRRTASTIAKGHRQLAELEDASASHGENEEEEPIGKNQRQRRLDRSNEAALSFFFSLRSISQLSRQSCDEKRSVHPPCCCFFDRTRRRKQQVAFQRRERKVKKRERKKKLEEKSFHSSLSPNKKKKEETLSLSNQPSFKGAHRSPHDAAAARLRGERGTLSL